MQSSPWYKLWRQRPGTHSGAFSYWLPSHEPSESAAIQILTLHSALHHLCCSLFASALRWSSLASPPRLCTGYLQSHPPVLPPGPYTHPLLQPCSALFPSPCPGSAFPHHPHDTSTFLSFTQEPKLLIATRVCLSAACAWLNTPPNTVLLQC